MEIKSICPYCGCGCSMYIVVEDSIAKAIKPDKSDPVSFGLLCLRGFTAHEMIYSGRIRTPLVRKEGDLVQSTFTEAYRVIFEKLSGIDGNRIAVTGNPHATNESNYIIQKFARAVLKTNNIDTCARLCHAASCFSLTHTLGTSVMPHTLAELEQSDCILFVGTNPRSNYPAAFHRILMAKRKGAHIVSIQPIFNSASQFATTFIKVNSGTHIFLINTILREIIRRGFEVDRGADNFSELVSVLEDNTPERACEVCGCDKEKLEEAIEAVGVSLRFSILYGMGMTQHSYGTHNALSCINLAIAKSGKIFPMRGRSNVQGAPDMGCDPSFIDNLTMDDKIRIEELWNMPFPKGVGRGITETAYDDDTNAFLLFGMNPAQSLPESRRVWRKLQDSFVVVVNSHFNKTCEFADVILPSCVWAEEEGTYTNAEGRVRRIHKALEPEGKSEWVILCELSEHFGYDMHYSHIGEIQEEIRKTIPAYRHVSFIGEGFREKEPKHKMYFPVQFRVVEDRRSPQFPFLLTTARSPVHFCTGEFSRNSGRLNKMEDMCMASLNPADAEEIGIGEEDSIKIISSAGSIEVKAKITSHVSRGTVVIPYHFSEVPINSLIPLKLDPLTGTPNYKTVAVRVEKGG